MQRDDADYTQAGHEPGKKSRKLVVSISLAVVILIAAGTSGLLYINSPKSPFPKTVSQAVNFPLYYPSTLPDGYRLKKGSLNVQNNIVFYTLENGGNTISISEQASPQHPLDLTSTPGFGEIPSETGQASAGIVNGFPVAIVIAEKTMINMQGSKSVPQDLLAKLTQSITVVH